MNSEDISKSCFQQADINFESNGRAKVILNFPFDFAFLH